MHRHHVLTALLGGACSGAPAERDGDAGDGGGGAVDAVGGGELHAGGDEGGEAGAGGEADRSHLASIEPDLSWTEELPTYDCPDPPDGVEVIEVRKWYAGHNFFGKIQNNRGTYRLSWYAFVVGASYDHEAECVRGYEWKAPVLEGTATPIDFAVSIYITHQEPDRPPDDDGTPPSRVADTSRYIGEHEGYDPTPWWDRIEDLGVRFHLQWVEDGETRRLSNEYSEEYPRGDGSYVDSRLCISSVGPWSHAGTFYVEPQGRYTEILDRPLFVRWSVGCAAPPCDCYVDRYEHEASFLESWGHLPPRE